MNILLIEPPLSLEKSRKIFPRHPPLILLSVAASLERVGFKVKVFDGFLEEAKLADIKDIVQETGPSLIGLCPADLTRFPPLEIDIILVNFLKKFFPAIPIVIFGIGKESILHALLTGAPDIDYAIRGDPEEVMVELAQHIAEENDPARISGLMIKRDPGHFTETGPPRIIDNLDRLVPPAWHLIDLNRYHFFPHRYKIPKTYPITTSRGCFWNRCIFCKEISVAGSSSYRCRSPENVLDEIAYAITEKGYKEIQFIDSNFNTEKEWFDRFYRGVKDRKISFRWSCLLRVDHANKEVLEAMKEIGCWNITFGIESSSQLLLDTIDKGISVDQIKKAVKSAVESGIEVTGSFLIGLPNEHPRDVINSAKFAVRNGLSYAQFFIAKWHEEHERFQSLGVLTKEWDYSQFDFRGRVFVPQAYKNISSLKQVQRKAYLYFYLHPRTIMLHMKHIKSPGDIKRLLLALLTLIKMNRERITLA